MIVPSDRDYLETKLIKRGEAVLNPDLQTLADWIDNQYSVNVLNIYYDLTPGLKGRLFPRVNIIFEHHEQQRLFQDEMGMYLPEKQEAVANKFAEVVKEDRAFAAVSKYFSKPKYETRNLLVIFGSFAPVQQHEANGAIPETDIESLVADLNNPDIWQIGRIGSLATLFFFKDDDIATARSNGVVDEVTDKYFRLLKRYDEFNYFDRGSFSIDVDSKQNFDDNYQGNWFYYYR